MHCVEIDNSEGYWGSHPRGAKQYDRSAQRTYSNPTTITTPTSKMKQPMVASPMKESPDAISSFKGYITPSTSSNSSSRHLSPLPSPEKVEPNTPASRSMYIRSAFQRTQSEEAVTFDIPKGPLFQSAVEESQMNVEMRGTDEFDEDEVASMIVADDEVDPSLTPKPRKNVPSQAPTTSTRDSTASSSFFQMPLAVDLPEEIIAYDKNVQKLMDEMHISWGVQYELARGVTADAWNWSDVTREKLEELKGSNAESAYRVANVMRNRTLNKKMNLSIWEELDREQAAILENAGRGLGLMGAWKGKPDWYGGQIQQIARVYKQDSSYRIKLEPMEMTRSHRFARFCGSRRMIQVRIPENLMYEMQETRNYLCKMFVLCGRVFVPVLAKEGSIYMIETNIRSYRDPQAECGDQHRKSFSQFINWHNPMALNKSQPISKWSARFALGVSTSIPVLEFQEDHIVFIPDEVATGWDKRIKPPSEKIMTDGCGFINRAAMMEITRRMKYATRPTAVQGRIGGAKGLWILDPHHDTDNIPKIWIRDSQNKIKYPNLNERSHRIFELLCASQPSPPIALSQQTILNLYFNSVPESTLTQLLVEGIAEEARPLMDWTQPMPCLWSAINKFGRVAGSRAQRIAAGKSRALGLVRREWGRDGLVKDDAGDMEEDGTPGVYTGRNEFSGIPHGLYELVLELLQAGFHPTKLELLREKIRYMISEVIKCAIEKYHIPLSESLNAFVIPDPLGVLKENQIYYRSSQPLKDPETETLFSVLQGEVLVGRYPVRLSSDIQKVTAVDIPELYEWSDVVIVPIKGDRSPASVLSGGDYDGDELFIIRESCLVKYFQSKPLVPEPKNLQQECFEVNAETLDAFSERSILLSKPVVQQQFQEVLLSGLNDAKVGIYSGFHDQAIIKLGYDHPETIRLAYMFNIILDSGKTGLRLKRNVFDKHRNKYNNSDDDHSRPSKDDPFILRRLIAAGQDQGDQLLREYDHSEEKYPNHPDNDLLAPLRQARDKAAIFQKERKDSIFVDELTAIQRRVDNVKAEWFKCCKNLRKEEQEPVASKRRSKKVRYTRNTNQDDPMLHVSRLYAEDIPGVVFTPNLEEIKASYAFQLSRRFAFAMAFQTLCNIKARACADGFASSTRMFDELKSIGPAGLKALEASREEANSF
ncbi:hypothetical protein AMATHDRAFT_64002 [Amanita thiersii Skay4041]|uniref:RNA-dependent RNA polymerase n=1 Tax=Amanita thiersii Skay4041 TaxID=703135 RepID=A0A2A9NN02_9AGAR|nr:hypothetical protein AMATHDRAFT_64002 [Amanita thiersii Skay4041]